VGEQGGGPRAAAPARTLPSARRGMVGGSGGGAGRGSPPSIATGGAASRATEGEAVFEGVRAVLWRHHRLLYSVFDYYGSLGSTLEVFGISSNGFKAFVSDCRLVDEDAPLCQQKHVDQLFIALNAEHGSSGKRDFNHNRFLNRKEFFAAVVRLTLMMYIMPGEIPDSAQAVEHVCAAHIAFHATDGACQDADALRRSSCYVEPVDTVLRAHEVSLRAIFEANAYGDGRIGEVLKSERMLGIGEWMDFVADHRLCDDAFTLDDAKQTFVWCRLRAIDESAIDSRAKLTQLYFEDFLEAIVRVASRKALPTDAEVVRAGCTDGGELLLTLMDECRPAAYAAFVQAHRPTAHSPPTQPVERCVAHLVSLLLRVEGAEPTTDRPLETTRGDALRFCQAQRQIASMGMGGLMKASN